MEGSRPCDAPGPGRGGVFLAASSAQKFRGNSHCSQRLRAGWLRKVQAVQFQCVPSSSSLLPESVGKDRKEVSRDHRDEARTSKLSAASTCDHKNHS